MALPVKTKLEDIVEVCSYLARKPTGATLAEARAVVNAIHLDGRKLSALKNWALIEDDAGKLKVTPAGRELAKGDDSRVKVLCDIIRRTPPYFAIVERAVHRAEDSLDSVAIAAHWHEHFRAQVSEKDSTLNEQAVCFMQVASGAGF